MITVPCRPPAGPPRLALRLAADDASALAAGLACGADALVLDGAIPADLRARRGATTLILALDGPDDPRLDASAAPDAVLLRDARSGRDVAALGARLAVHEAERGLPDGGTGLGLGILAEIRHPLGVLDARGFVGASPRLAGLGLDGAALAAALGAGAEGETLAQARGLIRLAAAAAGVTAFAMLGTEGAERAVTSVRREGFGLVIAHDPSDVANLRAAFLREGDPIF